MCKYMVDGNEQKGRGKTTAVSEDAEAEIFITFNCQQYILQGRLNKKKSALQYDTRGPLSDSEGNECILQPEDAYSKEQSHRRSVGSARHDGLTRTR